MIALAISHMARVTNLLPALAVALTIVLPSVTKAQSLVNNEVGGRVGLTRAWFAQVQVESAKHKVAHWLLDRDQLFALTSGGALQAFDAETGETLWTAELGEGEVSAAGVAVNSRYIAMLGVSRLYIIDRRDGHHLWSRQIGGATVAAPALSEKYAYVVLVNGRIEAYQLDQPDGFVWQYQSSGRIYQNPTTTGKVVSWPTDRGHLYVGQSESPRLLFRVETNDEIVASPAEQAPYLYVASLDGYLYCFHELTGSEHWRYSTGFAVTSRPAIVGDVAYVASEGPMLHAVNASTGEALWQVDGAAHFVALGKQHTYGLDRYGALLVIDNETGSVAGRLPTTSGNNAIVNDQSDRIFLVNERGLVQCLYEVGSTEPTWHRDPPAADQADGEAAQDEGETDSGDIGMQEASPGESEQSPFESDDEADADADDPNPFGF